MQRYGTHLSVILLGVASALFVSAVVAFRVGAPSLDSGPSSAFDLSVQPRARNISGDRNIFSVQLDDAAPAAPAPTASGPPPGLMLMGVMKGGLRSSAIIRSVANDSHVVYRTGDRLFGSEEYLARVEYDAVLLSGPWGRRRLVLGVPPDQQPSLVQAPSPAPSAPGQTISRSEVNASVRVAEELIGQSQILPEIRGNRIVGFRVSTVADNTIVKKMGIQPGDVIKAVNGQQLDSIERSTQVWREMKNSSEIHMLVERGGGDQTLSFYLKP